MNLNLTHKKIYLSVVVAKAKKSVIGKDGDMPWSMPSDLKYFKKVTMGKPVIMGRKTWESLPFPLPGRQNLVLTRNHGYEAKGAEVFTNKTDILARAHELAHENDVDEIMVMGGGQIYDLFLKQCDRVYITRIDADLEGDTTFPIFKIDRNWDLIDKAPLRKRPKDDYPSERRVYERRPDLFACI